MMKMKKKSMAMFLVGVLALTLIAGSLAYYSATVPVKNPMETDVYSSRTIEYFPPPVPLEPGSKVDKEVGAQNTGDYDLVIRIKMDEEWTRGGKSFASLTSDDGSKFLVPNNLMAKQAGGTAGEKDGKTAGDESVIYKDMVGVNGSNATWMYGGDGYWYYKRILPAKQQTEPLMDYLVAAKNMDMGKYNNSGELVSSTAPAAMEPLIQQYEAKEKAFNTARAEYEKALAVYESVRNQTNKNALDAKRVIMNNARDEVNAAYAAADAKYAWKTEDKLAPGETFTYKMSTNEIDDKLKGYAEADYVLTITTDFCQATPDAVGTEWGKIPDSVRNAWGW